MDHTLSSESEELGDWLHGLLDVASTAIWDVNVFIAFYAWISSDNESGHYKRSPKPQGGWQGTLWWLKELLGHDPLSDKRPRSSQQNNLLRNRSGNSKRLDKLGLREVINRSIYWSRKNESLISNAKCIEDK